MSDPAADGGPTWWEQQVGDTRAAMRHSLDAVDKALRVLRKGAHDLDEATLYDTEWAEGPGARFAAAQFDHIEEAVFTLRACLASGQGATA